MPVFMKYQLDVRFWEWMSETERHGREERQVLRENIWLNVVEFRNINLCDQADKTTV